VDLVIKKLRGLAYDKLLSIAGFGWLAAAAWDWHQTAGIAATGVALVLSAWTLED